MAKHTFAMKHINKQYEEAWEDAYKELNIEQQSAVNNTEGPVMVIAGPGTGKTQLLAVRIGKILKQSDISPYNILCLTYTDAGAIAMRTRLESFIGPEAHNVTIQTFHAFCNTIIKDNMQVFGEYRDLQPLDELEEVEVYKELINNFDKDHPLRRYKNQYLDMPRLKNLFTKMKQEGWTPEMIQENFNSFEKVALDPEISDFKYGRKTTDKDGTVHQKGDFNERKANEAVESLKPGVTAAHELNEYHEIMEKRERFDYQDMLLWVVKKFKENDHLKARYQEQYQYILVDEYQDTNGIQNELLFLLCDYWERPNIFIVGDDDQSIYRFQGANMESIEQFKKKYDPVEIVLTKNYRSSQKILDSAAQLINFNNDRLSKKYTTLRKDLTESRKEESKPAFSPEPMYWEFNGETQEEAAIIQKIEQLISEKVPHNNIGVIYTKHAIAENLIRYFSQKKIPISVKRRVNALHEKDVVRIITILRYLQEEISIPCSDELTLFEILHYDFWKIKPLDIAKLNLYCRDAYNKNIENRRIQNWREVLADLGQLKQAGVSDPEKLSKVNSIIEKWITDVHNVTIQTLIEMILTDSNMLGSILSDADKTWRLELINTFFDFVKEKADKVGNLSLSGLLDTLDNMYGNNIALPAIKIFYEKEGINFMTAHGAKGLEFEHVFIMRCTDKAWEKNRGSNQEFKLPPNVIAPSDEKNPEESRRLFYVAMTRAKDFLYISYPVIDNKGASVNRSMFVSESIPPKVEPVKIVVNNDVMSEYVAELNAYQNGEVKLIDDNLVDRLLDSFRMSTTSLNKYLQCKVAFYFENILRVPMGKNAAMSFGSAIHYAMEQFFKDFQSTNPISIGSVNKLLEFYNKGMDRYRSGFTQREYDNYLEYGREILTEYYDRYSADWLKIPNYELEYNISSAEYMGVPLSGKLDKISIFNDHLIVTDYKTGNPDRANVKLKRPKDDEDIGGDYWRQIVFYRILLDRDKKYIQPMKRGVMDFVEKSKRDDTFKNEVIEVTQEDIQIVGQQITQAYRDIKAHIFMPGCNDEQCQWCNFVNRNMPIGLIDATDDNTDQSEVKMTYPDV